MKRESVSFGPTCTHKTLKGFPHIDVISVKTINATYVHRVLMIFGLQKGKKDQLDVEIHLGTLYMVDSLRHNHTI